MKQTGDSLRGQNSIRRNSGTRSSRVHPTTLFKTIQKLDREITSIDKQLRFHLDVKEKWVHVLKKKMASLDEKRMVARNFRKYSGRIK